MRLDTVTAVGLFQAQIRQTSATQWELDLPLQIVQKGRISDVERWYDRFTRQVLAYWNLHSARLDPPWTAVTGYYSAFFGAQTLMGMLGLAARTFPNLGSLPRGFYRLSEAPSLYAGNVLLQFRKQGGGSHRTLWTQLTGVLDTLAAIPGNDAGTLLTINSLRDLVLGPPSLAATRNQINYSLDFSLDELGAWRSEWPACTTAVDLERRLQSTVPAHPAQRFELVSFATGALAISLYEDYISRGISLDLRPRARRRQRIAVTDESHPAAQWF